MKHSKLQLIIAVGLMLLLAFPSCKTDRKESGANRQKQAITAEVIVITPKSIDFSYSFTGNLLPYESVELRSEAPGRIVNISFEEGQRVSKGSLLVKINDSELQAQLKKTRLQAELSQEDVKRKRELYKIKGISKEDLDIAENKLAGLEADAEYISAQIEKTGIRAPFNGICGLRYVSPGAYVTSNTLISSFIQNDPLRIECSLPESMMNYVKPGQTINFLNGKHEKQFQAQIYVIENQVDPITRMFKIRARCPNPTGELLAGSYVTIMINTSKEEKHIMIPAKAVIPVMDDHQVWVLRNGKAENVKIKTGIRTAEEVEILEGLSSGDSLITTALLQIKPGIPIKSVGKQKKS